ncbi:MAG: molecular chaperone DnaJ [Alphaproteobacteria bacterium]
MAYLLLGFVVLAGVLLLIRWFRTADPTYAAKAVKVTAGVALAAAAVFLAVTGRLVGVVAAIVAFAPLFIRWKALWHRVRSAAGPAPGRQSKVATAWLDLTLDHDSGEMDGEVRAGAQKGRRLGDIDEAALRALLDELRTNDPQGAPLLEAYLDRRFGPGWRAAGGSARAEGEETRARPRAAMTAEEAREILGLAPGAGEEDIRAAHRRLMVRLHPDRGGSTYLAAKINRARDVLLGR